MIAGGSIGGADAKAEDSGRKRRTIFVAIVGGLVVILGILALVYSRRAKRAAAIEAQQEERHAELVREVEERRRAESASAHSAQQRAHEESILRAKRAAAASAAVGTMLCPTCKREYPPPAGNFCPQDATRLVPLPEDATIAPAGGVCPACRRGFEPGVKVCPHGRRRAAAVRGRSCDSDSVGEREDLPYLRRALRGGRDLLRKRRHRLGFVELISDTHDRSEKRASTTHDVARSRVQRFREAASSKCAA